MGKEKKRKLIVQYLKHKKVRFNQENHFPFFKFLSREDMKHLLESFLVICSGLYSSKESLLQLNQIFTTYDKYQKIYTFTEVVKMDSDWYLYLQDNIYPDGTPRENEKRLGLNRDRVNDIMKINHLINTEHTFDDSMTMYFHFLVMSARASLIITN